MASLTHARSYAYFCTSCLAAELAADYIDNRGCCNTQTCTSQWWAACGLKCLTALCSASCAGFVGWLALGVVCVLTEPVSPWICTMWYTQSREAMKAKYLLPHDELCCDNAVSSFLPTHLCCLNCSACALYQQAYYIKHVQMKEDYKCFIYKACCAQTPATGGLHMTQQPCAEQQEGINMTQQIYGQQPQGMDMTQQMHPQQPQGMNMTQRPYTQQPPRMIQQPYTQQPPGMIKQPYSQQPPGMIQQPYAQQPYHIRRE